MAKIENKTTTTTPSKTAKTIQNNDVFIFIRNNN
jgi:hypothetical protein